MGKGKAVNMDVSCSWCALFGHTVTDCPTLVTAHERRLLKLLRQARPCVAGLSAPRPSLAVAIDRELRGKR